MSVIQSEVVITDWLAVNHDVSLVRKPPALQSDAGGGHSGGGGGEVGRDGVVRVTAVPRPGNCSVNRLLTAASLPAGDIYLSTDLS